MATPIAVAPLDPRAPLAPQLITGIRAAVARYRSAIDAIPPAARDTPRADGGWSANQILEHLCLANGAYLRAMTKAADRTSPVPMREGGRSWQPTLVGRLLVWALSGERKLPAPSRAQPAPTVRPDVLHAFLHTHDEICALLQRLDGRDLNAIRFASPLATWLHMNVADAGVVLLRHCERHARQLERLVAERARR